MELKVQYREMDDVNNNTDINKVDLEKEIEYWTKQIGILKDNWKGQDADTFYNHMDHYLKKLRRVPIVYGNISTFMKKANIEYEQKDEDFANHLKETAVRESI